MKTKTSRVGMRAKQSKERGFTYLMSLVAVAVVAISAAIGGELTSTLAQREREAELLFRGQAIQRAVGDYYEAGPAGVKSFPRTLDALLTDPRYPERHYLRDLYRDPFGGEWRIVRAPDGGIAGVASPNQQVPIKKANFPTALNHFAAAQSLSEWEFIFVPSPSLPKSPRRLAAPVR